MKKGFVLVLALLFVFLLALFAMVILSLAGTHHASSAYLLQNEKARIAAENGFRSLIDRHNVEPADPRFFFNPVSWNGESIQPFEWNDHTVEARRKTAWSTTGTTAFEVVARRGRISSRLNVQVRQQRLEDFALYTNAEQTVPGASLFDGSVYSSAMLRLSEPQARFLHRAQAEIVPPEFAVHDARTLQSFAYPEVAQLIRMDRMRDAAARHGLLITGGRLPLWDGAQYMLNLDLLHLQKTGELWEISYNGTPLGSVGMPYLWFDSDLELTQTWRTIPFLASTKLSQPLYLMSAANVRLSSGIQALDLEKSIHPIAILASGAIVLGPQVPRVCRLNAFLCATGSIETETGRAGISIGDTARATSVTERDGFLHEVFYSNFIVDEDKRLTLVDAVNKDERTIWFRGTIMSSQSIQWPMNLRAVHFSSSDTAYTLFQSLPFVEIVSGSREWL